MSDQEAEVRNVPNWRSWRTAGVCALLFFSLSLVFLGCEREGEEMPPPAEDLPPPSPLPQPMEEVPSSPTPTPGEEGQMNRE